MSGRSKELRRLLGGETIVVAPGAYDGLSARLVEQAGFPVVYLTGGGIARSFGQPDIGAISYVEVANRIRSIAAVTTVPLVADLDSGHGGVATIMRAVREFAAAGASAIHLEDREVPRRHREAMDNVLPADEMVGRIEAALSARPDSDFVVIARTDCLPTLGINEAIERANRYAEAGADLIYVEHMRTVAELESVARYVKAPKLVSLNKGLGVTPTARELGEMGYRLLTLPADAQLAAIHAMQRLLAHVAAQGGSAGFDEMISFPARDEIVGLKNAVEAESRFLPVRASTVGE